MHEVARPKQMSRKLSDPAFRVSNCLKAAVTTDLDTVWSSSENIFLNPTRSISVDFTGFDSINRLRMI